ncbi:MAG TPA: hypothetical protein VH599_19790 [Ktedonobacterales bacterium]|jgi:hypothetical protein
MAESTKEVAARRPKPKTGSGAPATGKKTTTKSAPLDRAIQEATTSAPERTARASKAGENAETRFPQAVLPEGAAVKPRFGFFRSLGRKDTAEAPASASGAATSANKPQRPANPSMGRFFFGMSLYMILALAAQFALSFIFQALPESYRTQAIVTLPLLGGVTPYLLAWMIVLILILYALYKFKVLPRTLGQPRPRAAAADPRAKAAPTTKAAHGPVEGPDDDAYARVKARIRAERRKTRRS